MIFLQMTNKRTMLCMKPHIFSSVGLGIKLFGSGLWVWADPINR